MIFATLASPDQLGAYAFFALGCASVQGLFETAILPSFWAPLLQAKKDGDDTAYSRAEQKLTRACLVGGAAVAAVTLVGLTVLTWFLPHPAYAANIHLLYFIAAAYSLLILANIPHYRLYAVRLDSRIVLANVTAFVLFLVLIVLLINSDRSTAVPLALALSCAWLFLIKSVMARRLTSPVIA